MEAKLVTNNKFYGDIETYNLLNMFCAMGEGDLVSVAMDENETASGESVVYYFVNHESTATKPFMTYVYAEEPQTETVEDERVQLNEIARLINLDGVAIWYIFKSIPYCIPVLHSTPQLIANSIPGDGGNFLKDMITIAQKYREDETLFDYNLDEVSAPVVTEDNAVVEDESAESTEEE